MSALAQAAQQRSRSRIAASSAVFAVVIDRAGARDALRRARRDIIILSRSRGLRTAAAATPLLCHSRARGDGVNRITRSNSTDAGVLTRLCRFLGVHAAVEPDTGAESFLAARERG